MASPRSSRPVGNPLDDLIARRIVPTAASDQIAAFGTTMHSCLGVDGNGHPALDRQMRAYIDQLSNEIGRTDSKQPGFDAAAPPNARRMPSEVYITEAYETTITELGPEIDQKIALAKLGKPVATARPMTSATPGLGARFWTFVRRHWIIGVVLLVVGLIEYFVGIQWLERSGLAPDDSSAHIVALGIPLLSAAIAIVGATVFDWATVRNPSKPRSSRAIQVITFVLGVLLYVGTLIGGGFLLARGADTTDDERRFVVFMIYVGFAIGGLLVIFAVHLLELERDSSADRNALMKQRGEEDRAVHPTEQQITESNIAVLEQYHDLFEVLVQAREGAIKAYVAGVKGGGGETSVLEVWDSRAVETAPLTLDVTWPDDLRTVITDLKKQTAAPTQA